MLGLIGGGVPNGELLMPSYRTHASTASSQAIISSETLGHRSVDPDELRMRASRYRLLAETLFDPRVVAVVQACARDLETEAILTETADDAWEHHSGKSGVR